MEFDCIGSWSLPFYLLRYVTVTIFRKLFFQADAEKVLKTSIFTPRNIISIEEKLWSSISNTPVKVGKGSLPWSVDWTIFCLTIQTLMIKMDYTCPYGIFHCSVNSGLEHMSHSMFFKMMFQPKWFPTDLTTVRFLSCMDSLMNYPAVPWLTHKSTIPTFLGSYIHIHCLWPTLCSRVIWKEKIKSRSKHELDRIKLRWVTPQKWQNDQQWRIKLKRTRN